MTNKTLNDGLTGRFYRPANEADDKRAETTGEDTRCATCGAGFMSHRNGQCPKDRVS